MIKFLSNKIKFLSNNEVRVFENQGFTLDYDRQIVIEGRKAWITTVSWSASGVWLGLEYVTE